MGTAESWHGAPEGWDREPKTGVELTGGLQILTVARMLAVLTTRDCIEEGGSRDCWPDLLPRILGAVCENTYCTH